MRRQIKLVQCHNKSNSGKYKHSQTKRIDFLFLVQSCDCSEDSLTMSLFNLVNNIIYLNSLKKNQLTIIFLFFFSFENVIFAQQVLVLAIVAQSSQSSPIQNGVPRRWLQSLPLPIPSHIQQSGLILTNPANFFSSLQPASNVQLPIFSYIKQKWNNFTKNTPSKANNTNAQIATVVDNVVTDLPATNIAPVSASAPPIAARHANIEHFNINNYLNDKVIRSEFNQNVQKIQSAHQFFEIKYTGSHPTSHTVEATTLPSVKLPEQSNDSPMKIQVNLPAHVSPPLFRSGDDGTTAWALVTQLPPMPQNPSIKFTV